MNIEGGLTQIQGACQLYLVTARGVVVLAPERRRHLIETTLDELGDFIP